MLRLASARVRGLLLSIGVVIGVWLPLSFHYWMYAEWEYSVGHHSLVLVSSRGAIDIAVWDSSGGLLLESGAGLRRGQASLSYSGGNRALLPVLPHANEWVNTVFSIPLWLPTLLCLAWPVTSFIIARCRRKGRGFAVEARTAGSTPLPPGEVPAQPSGADGEGSQQHATE